MKDVCVARLLIKASAFVFYVRSTQKMIQYISVPAEFKRTAGMAATLHWRTGAARAARPAVRFRSEPTSR